MDVEEGKFQRGPVERDSRNISRNGMNRWDGVRVDDCSAGGDALSHEVDRQPNIRGLLAEPLHHWSERNSHSPGAMDMGSLQQHHGYHETAEGGAHPKELLRDGNGRGRGVTHRGRHVECGPEGEGADASEEGSFERSLRGSAARVRRGDGGVSKRDGRWVVRRPEWNSDTAGAGSLDDPLASIVTDNSPAALEVS